MAATHKSRPWTNAEVEALRQLYKVHDKATVAKLLNRSYYAVKSKLTALGWLINRPWTEWEVELLAAQYPTTKARCIAEKLNRTPAQVTRKAFDLCLSKRRQ